jgi:hypothetical protein
MRNRERENIEKESLSRNPGEGIFEGRIVEATERHIGDTLEASWRNLGGIIMGAFGKHLEAIEGHIGGWRQLRNTLEASRRPPQKNNVFVAV